MGCLSNGSLLVQCNFSAYKFEPTEYIPFEQDFLHSKSLRIVCLPLLPLWMVSMFVCFSCLYPLVLHEAFWIILRAFHSL